jgi:hypothetical protein
VDAKGSGKNLLNGSLVSCDIKLLCSLTLRYLSAECHSGSWWGPRSQDPTLSLLQQDVNPVPLLDLCEMLWIE